MGVTKPPVPDGMPVEIEWIEIDGETLPFQRMQCRCPNPHLICIVYRWGRCGRCGVKPQNGGPDDD